MTCIIGYIDRENKKILISGDSAGVNKYMLYHRKDSKIFIREPFIMGFTGSFRMGQLLMADTLEFQYILKFKIIKILSWNSVVLVYRQYNEYNAKKMGKIKI